MIPEAESAIYKMEEVYKDGLRQFVAWCQQEWRHDTKEQWEKSNVEDWPGNDVEYGYNKAIDGLDGALDIFLDEMRP